MKWIGQHIYDLVARFRSDIYLEGISTSTETDMLVVDSNNKISKRAIDAITVDVSDFMTNGVDNRILTATGTDAMNAEGNLTFNGTTLTLADGCTFASAGNVTIAPGEESSNTSLAINNAVADQKALDIIAENTTVDVLEITADSVTTANVIDISCDALTTGSALNIEDDSSVGGIGGARSLVKINQKNTSGTGAKALEVISSGGADAVSIDANASGDAGQNKRGLVVLLDRTSPSSGTAQHNDTGVSVHVDSTSLGTSTVKGLYVDVEGATSGTSTAYGMDIVVADADTNYGIQIKSADAQLRLVAAADNDDIGTITVADTGDMTIATIGDGTTDSDLTLDADGDIKLEPATGKSILLDGTIDIDAGVVTGATSITSTSFVGALTGQADTVATIAGLAPNTATTQATQGNITSCANLATIGTITTGVWQGTAIASAYMASATDSAKGAVELATTGEADTGTDTARAVTPAGLKSHIDARYSYQYINFSFKATNVGPDLWRSPSSQGPEYYDWDNNHGSGVTQAASDAPKDVDINTTISVDYLDQTSGFIIPKACKIDGFYGNCKVNGTNPNTLRPVIGFFRAAEPADGNNSDLTATCVAFDSYDTSGGNRKNRFLKLENSGLNTDLAQGDLLFPAVGFDATASDSAGDIWGSFTIVLKTLIP